MLKHLGDLGNRHLAVDHGSHVQDGVAVVAWQRQSGCLPWRWVGAEITSVVLAGKPLGTPLVRSAALIRIPSVGKVVRSASPRRLHCADLLAMLREQLGDQPRQRSLIGRS